MLVKKALLLATATVILLAAGCVSARDHQRKVGDLEQKLEGERREAVEAQRALEELRRSKRQADTEIQEAVTRAEELEHLSERLRRAKEERERNLREMEDLVKDISGMTVETRAEGDFIIIENEILFDPGQIELREQAKNTIRDNVVPYIQDQLEQNQKQLVRIDGHTDGQPIELSPWDDNYHLSVMRAHSVMRFMADEGVPEKNLFLAGFGPNNPIVEPKEPEDDIEENRRVEILLVPYGEDDIQSILDDFVR